MLPATNSDRIVKLQPGVLPDLDSPGATRLIFDAHAIDLIDSRLVGRLIELIRAMHPNSVCVRQASPRVRVQLSLLGLDRIMYVEAA